MPFATIIIRQNDFNQTPGSRDDLVLNTTVTLLNTEFGVTDYLWQFIDVPENSNAVIFTPTQATASFIPDVEGTYLIKLTINHGAISNQIGAAVKTTYLDFRIPAAAEDGEFSSTRGWAQAVNNAFKILDDGYGNLLSGVLNVKPAATVLGTSNISLSGTATIDGYALSSGQRVLLVGQTNQIQNGLWVVQSGSWIRPTDFSAGTHAKNSFVFINNGTLYAATGWICTNTSNTDKVDTNALQFQQYSGQTQYVAGDGITLNGTQFFVGPGQITNSMLANNTVGITAGAGLTGGNSNIALGGTTTISLPTVGISAGVYQGITFDAYGRAISAIPVGAVYADVYSGDWGNKISQAVASLPSTGGVINALGLIGSHNISATIIVDRPVTILVGSAQITCSTTPAFNITASAGKTANFAVVGLDRKSSTITSAANGVIFNISGDFFNNVGDTQQDIAISKLTMFGGSGTSQAIVAGGYPSTNFQNGQLLITDCTIKNFGGTAVYIGNSFYFNRIYRNYFEYNNIGLHIDNNSESSVCDNWFFQAAAGGPNFQYVGPMCLCDHNYWYRNSVTDTGNSPDIILQPQAAWGSQSGGYIWITNSRFGGEHENFDNARYRIQLKSDSAADPTHTVIAGPIHILNNFFIGGSAAATINYTYPGNTATVTLSVGHTTNTLSGRNVIVVNGPAGLNGIFPVVSVIDNLNFTITISSLLGSSASGSCVVFVNDVYAISLENPHQPVDIRGNTFLSVNHINDVQPDSSSTSEVVNSVYKDNFALQIGFPGYIVFKNGGKLFSVIQAPLDAAQNEITPQPRQIETPYLNNRAFKSETLTAWTATNGMTVSGNQTDPFGTTHAVLLSLSGTTPSSQALRQQIETSTTMPTDGRLTVKFWAKAGTLNTVQVGIFNSTTGLWAGNLQTFNLSSTWKQYKFVTNPIATGNICFVEFLPGQVSFVNGSIYICAPQVSDFDCSYFPNTNTNVSNVVSTTAGSRLQQALIVNTVRTDSGTSLTLDASTGINAAGAITFTGTPTLTGNTLNLNASSGTLALQIGGNNKLNLTSTTVDILQFAGQANNKIISVATAPVDTSGVTLTIQGQIGGAASAVGGGDSGTVIVQGSQGGNGTGILNPGKGGNVNLLGGTGGTGGSGNANGGSAVVRAGAGSGSGLNGSVLIGDANTSSITIGSTTTALTISGSAPSITGNSSLTLNSGSGTLAMQIGGSNKLTLSSGSSDILQFAGSSGNKTIAVATAANDTAGVTLTIQGQSGGTASSTGGGTGGTTQILGGAGGAGNGILNPGNGFSLVLGGGGGGSGGTGNSNGGSVFVRGGLKQGTGANGNVNIGDSSTSNIAIGSATGNNGGTTTTTFAGTVSFPSASISNNALLNSPIIDATQTPYNADSSGIIDATNALNSAITAANASGSATVYLPPGTYSFANTITMKSGVRLRGASGTRTLLKFTGATGPFISFSSVNTASIEDLELRYTNSSLTTAFVTTNNSSALYFGGIIFRGLNVGNLTTAASLLDLTNCIEARIHRCNFWGAQVGIQGINITGFSNANKINECVFNYCEVAAIQNPELDWHIDNCVFEPTTTGKASGIISSGAAYVAEGLVVSGCYFSDASVAGNNWIDLYAQGVSFTGNYINNCNGTSGFPLTLISSIVFETGSRGISFKGNHVIGAENITAPAQPSLGSWTQATTAVEVDFTGNWLINSTTGAAQTPPISQTGSTQNMFLINTANVNVENMTGFGTVTMSGTSTFTTSGRLAVGGWYQSHRAQVADANYTVNNNNQTGDFGIVYTSLTAARTVTVNPTGASTTQAREIYIDDASGNASNTNTISVVSTTGTINGVAQGTPVVAICSPYGSARLRFDGYNTQLIKNIDYPAIAGEVGVTNKYYPVGDSRRYGTIGNNIVDDTNALQNCITSAIATGTPAYFPAGTYKITATLVFSSALGVKFSGAGPATTRFAWAGGLSGTVFNISGCARCTFEQFAINGSGDTVGILYNGVISPAAISSLNLFRSIFFETGFTYCLRIGTVAYQCDQTMYQKCSFYHASVSGVSIEDANAVMHNFYDCVWQYCNEGITAIHGTGGSFNLYGCGFAGNGQNADTNSWDISVYPSSRGTVISGCWSEGSYRFFRTAAGSAPTSVTLDNCSVNGMLDAITGGTNLGCGIQFSCTGSLVIKGGRYNGAYSSQTPNNVLQFMMGSNNNHRSNVIFDGTVFNGNPFQTTSCRNVGIYLRGVQYSLTGDDTIPGPMSGWLARGSRSAPITFTVGNTMIWSGAAWLRIASGTQLNSGANGNVFTITSNNCVGNSQVTIDEISSLGGLPEMPVMIPADAGGKQLQITIYVPANFTLTSDLVLRVSVNPEPFGVL